MKRRLLPALSGVLSLAVSVTAFPASAGGGGETSWMPGSFGLGIHWTAGVARDMSADPKAWGAAEWNAVVDAFDTEAFAETVKACGAKHIIFTLTHALQQMPCPNAALDRLMPGRTAARDLIGDLLASLAARDIKLILYYNHSCNNKDDPPWKEACGYNAIVDAQTMAAFTANICSILEEVSKTYGPRLAGFWFDSGSTVNRVNGQEFSWTNFVSAARAGNPKLAICVNREMNGHKQYCGELCDYAAGETERLGPFSMGGPQNGLQDHNWTCMDDRRWLWSGAWAKPYFPDYQALQSWIVSHRAARRMATLNVLIDPAGNLNPLCTNMLITAQPIGMVWSRARYNPDVFRAAPASSNTLRGLAAVFEGSRWPAASGVGVTPVAVVTDGRIPRNYHDRDAEMGFGFEPGASFTWTLANAVDVYRFNIFTKWNDGNADGFVVKKIEIRHGDAACAWEDLHAPSLRAGMDEMQSLTGGKLAVSLFNDQGLPLATNVSAWRVTFGDLENGHISIPEMELLSAP